MILPASGLTFVQAQHQVSSAWLSRLRSTQAQGESYNISEAGVGTRHGFAAEVQARFRQANGKLAA